jgi:flagellar hook-basal body complex protein FliE
MIDAISSATSPVGEAFAPSAVAPAGKSGASAPAAGADFGAILGQLAVGTADVLKNAETLSVAGVTGKASMQQVVDAVMSAEQTLQGAIAIRDKVVSAYLEVSRMQI